MDTSIAIAASIISIFSFLCPCRRLCCSPRSLIRVRCPVLYFLLQRQPPFLELRLPPCPEMFHVLRINIVTGYDNYVLFSPDDVVVATVSESIIAAVIPPITQHLRCLFQIVPVTIKHRSDLIAISPIVLSPTSWRFSSTILTWQPAIVLPDETHTFAWPPSWAILTFPCASATLSRANNEGAFPAVSVLSQMLFRPWHNTTK